MTKTLACKDTGMTECPYIARGQTIEEVLNDAGKHGKEVHGLSVSKSEYLVLVIKWYLRVCFSEAN